MLGLEARGVVKLLPSAWWLGLGSPSWMTSVFKLYFGMRISHLGLEKPDGGGEGPVKSLALMVGVAGLLLSR